MAQVPPPSGHLMLSPATLKGKGRCSSVAMYVIPSNNLTVVVSVRDATLSPKLYYTVGVVNKNGANTTWSERTYYGVGQHPSVCIVKIGSDLYAIVCHGSDIYKMCYYRVGQIVLNSQLEGSINWGDSSAKQIACGLKPKITANDGTIIVIMEEICTWNTLSYRVADIAKVNIGNRTITWTQGPKDDKNFFQGLDPDISVNSKDEVIVVCRSYDRQVKAKLGKVHGDKKKINWSAVTKELPTCGVNPTICFNSKRQVVEIHENIWKELSITCGRNVDTASQWDCDSIKDKAVQWDNIKEKALIHYGEYPALALSEEGVILEMHCTPFGFSLYYSQGTLVEDK